MLNRLRGLYAKSPPRVRKLVSGILGLLPPHLQYGPDYKKTWLNIVRSYTDSNFVIQTRTERLREILSASYNHSPYYKPLLEGKDFLNNPFDALASLPILSKDLVREQCDALLVQPKQNLDVVSTSGSSGTPLMFYLDQGRSVREWAYVNFIWSKISYKAGDVRAVLRGTQFENVDAQPWEYEVALKELRLSPFHLTPATMDTYLALIEQHKVNFIHGYPSAISILAKHATLKNWKPPSSLKGILPISESLFSYQREQIAEGFGNLPIQAFYGLSEKVCIARETQLDQYEFEPLYGITEILDEHGNPVQPGEQGRIVSTGLLCAGMPMLRYDTGDTATLVEAAHSQNKYRLQVRNIRSARGLEFLVGQSGALISMAAINLHSPDFAKIKEFQFYQDTPGIATLKTVPADANEQNFESVRRELQTKIGNDLKIQMQVVQQLSQNTRGKRFLVDQQLKISPAGLTASNQEKTSVSF